MDSPSAHFNFWPTWLPPPNSLLAAATQINEAARSLAVLSCARFPAPLIINRLERPLIHLKSSMRIAFIGAIKAPERLDRTGWRVESGSGWAILSTVVGHVDSTCLMAGPFPTLRPQRARSPSRSRNRSESRCLFDLIGPFSYCYDFQKAACHVGRDNEAHDGHGNGNG